MHLHDRAGTLASTLIYDSWCDSFEDSLFSLASNYGDLELLAQLVNTRESSLSIDVMNVHTKANWDKRLCFVCDCSSDLSVI